MKKLLGTGARWVGASGFLALVLASGPVFAKELDDTARHDALIAAFNHHFGESLSGIPAAHLDHAHEMVEGKTQCLTGLVAELRADWDLFTPEEQRVLTARLMPWRESMDLAARPSPVAPPPAAPCFGYVFENVLETDRFSLQWEDGALTSTEAAEFLEALELSYDIEVDEMGWLAPEGVSRYPMMVLVENGSYAGAYTTVDWCDGVGYVPYIVAEDDSFFGDLDWGRTMAAHEFNHSLQFSYGFAHEFWYWEATATWMEEHVYPDINDWRDYVWVYGQYPHIGMNASDTRGTDNTLFAHTYAMAVFNFYLDEHVGGPELVEDLWREARGDSSSYGLWLPDAIEARGYDFEDTLADFMAVYSVLDYAEPRNFQDANVVERVRELPASGASETRTAPQSIGQNYIRFESDVLEAGQFLHVSLEMDDSASSWVVVLVEGTNSVQQMERVDIDRDGLGYGVIEVSGDHDVYLIVSPIERSAQGSRYNWNDPDTFAYAWEAQLAETSEPIEEPGGSDGGDGSEGSDGGDGSGDGSTDTGGGSSGTVDGTEDEKPGIGCSSAPTRLSYLFLAGLIGMGLRRR